VISPDDVDTVGVKATSRPLPGWWMHDQFLHEHPQNLVLLRGTGSIPLLLNTFGGGPGRQVGETLRDIFYGLGRFQPLYRDS